MGREYCHPLLRGGRRGSKYTHTFSSAQMESLASICETVLPPLQLECLKSEPKSKAVQFFWKASGSEFSVPDEVLIPLCFSLYHKLYWFVCGNFSIIDFGKKNFCEQLLSVKTDQEERECDPNILYVFLIAFDLLPYPKSVTGRYTIH